MKPLTAAEIGALIGVTPSAVRQIVRREGIEAAGQDGKAKLYWFGDIKRHVGGHDRRIHRKRRSLVSQ